MVSSKPKRGGGGPLTIFVGGIPRNLTSRNVEKKFLQFGPIDSVRKPGPGNYAFIQYKNSEAAQIAFKKGHTLFSREDNVTVEFSHTREGGSSAGRRRSGSGKRPSRRKSMIAKKAAALKKKAIRGKKRKVAARDRRESDRDRSPLVLIRRGQRSPSLIGGRSPGRYRRRSSFSPGARSPVTKHRKRSSVGTPPDTPDEDRKSLRKSRSPTKNRRKSTLSPERRWSLSLSPGPSPARSWSRSGSSVGSESPEENWTRLSKSPSPDHLSDRSRSRSTSESPVLRRKKRRGRPSTPSDPSPASYRSSLSPNSNDRRSPTRSLTPPSRRNKKQWGRRESNRTLSPSPDRSRSPAIKSPLGKKRKRNRSLRKNRKRGGKVVGGLTRSDSGGGIAKKKKRPPKGIRMKIKAREKDSRTKMRDVKPVSLLDIDVKPAIRPLMDLTPMRRPPSPRERPPSPRPLLSRGRSMSMSPTPSPHRQPLETSYRRSPSPNYSYGGYRGGLYYRQQEASVVNYRGEMNSGSYKSSGGYGSSYGSTWDRGRMSPTPLMSSGYSMPTSSSYRSRTPPRRRSPSPLMGRRYRDRDDRSPMRSPRSSPRDTHRGLPSIISRSLRAGMEATKKDRGSRDRGSRDKIVERVRHSDRDRDRERERDREEKRRERVRDERRTRDDVRTSKDLDRGIDRHREERPAKSRHSRSPVTVRRVVRSRSRSPLRRLEVRGRESRSPISREERQSRRDQKLGRILGSRSPSMGDRKAKSDRRRSPANHSSRRDRGHGSPRR